MERFFDQLSKQLAGARTRREALGALASTLASVWLGSCTTGPTEPTAIRSSSPLTPSGSGLEAAPGSEAQTAGAGGQAAVDPAPPVASLARTTDGRPACGSTQKNCKTFCCANKSMKCCPKAKSSKKRGCCTSTHGCCKRFALCCPKTHPYLCSSVRLCYATRSAAINACGKGRYIVDTCTGGK